MDLLLFIIEVVDPPGFEPGTNGLKVRCSTAELRVQTGGEGRIRTYCVSYVPDLQSGARPPSEQLPQKLVGDERIELPTLAV